MESPKYEKEHDPEEVFETAPEFSVVEGHGHKNLERGLKSRHIQFLALG